MKTLLLILFLTLSVRAQEFVQFTQPFQIPTADGYVLTIQPGDCFPSRGIGGAGRLFLVFGPDLDNCPGNIVTLQYGPLPKAAYDRALNRMRAQYQRALKSDEAIANLPEAEFRRYIDEMRAIEARRQQSQQTEYLREVAEDLEWQRIRRGR